VRHFSLKEQNFNEKTILADHVPFGGVTRGDS
jgi:hypothetical protein